MVNADLVTVMMIVDAMIVLNVEMTETEVLIKDLLIEVIVLEIVEVIVMEVHGEKHRMVLTMFQYAEAEEYLVVGHVIGINVVEVEQVEMEVSHEIVIVIGEKKVREKIGSGEMMIVERIDLLAKLKMKLGEVVIVMIVVIEDLYHVVQIEDVNNQPQLMVRMVHGNQ